MRHTLTLDEAEMRTLRNALQSRIETLCDEHRTIPQIGTPRGLFIAEECVRLGDILTRCDEIVDA